MTSKLRTDALAACEAAIAAANPAEQTKRHIDEHRRAIEAAAHVHLLAAGKAAIPMMRAALQALAGISLGTKIAVTNYENVEDITGVDVHGAAHPLPDENGERAASAIETAACAMNEGELVICLISGGASALLPAPIEGLSLEQKIEITNDLLKCGADITEINTVRQALSRLKGGGLAKAIAPAKYLSLILSDVPGDDPAIIASGPTYLGEKKLNAHEVVKKFGIKLPVALPESSVEIEVPNGSNIVIGSNDQSVLAMIDCLKGAGYTVHRIGDWLDGSAEDAARMFAQEAAVAGSGPVAFVAGGETSVEVSGNGLGGRNQHMALSFAPQARELKRSYCFASCGTDGRDGPTEAAGGIVDDGTLALALKRNADLQDFLARHDSHHGLKAIDGLISTGGTGTNVADVQVLLLG